MTTLGALVAIVVALTGCGAADAPRPDPLGKKLANKSSQVSKADSDLLERGHTYSAAWNSAVAPLGRDYVDPNVGARRWLSKAGPRLEQMRQAMDSLRLRAAMFEDPALRRFFAQTAAAYPPVWSAWNRLRSAVVTGPEREEKAAQRAVDRSTARQQAAGERQLALLRLYYSAAELERIRKQREAIVDQALQSGR